MHICCMPLPMEPVESKRDKKRVQVSQDDEIQVLKVGLFIYIIWDGDGGVFGGDRRGK